MRLCFLYLKNRDFAQLTLELLSPMKVVWVYESLEFVHISTYPEVGFKQMARRRLLAARTVPGNSATGFVPSSLGRITVGSLDLRCEPLGFAYEIALHLLDYISSGARLLRSMSQRRAPSNRRNPPATDWVKQHSGFRSQPLCHLAYNAQAV